MKKIVSISILFAFLFIIIDSNEIFIINDAYPADMNISGDTLLYFLVFDNNSSMYMFDRDLNYITKTDHQFTFTKFSLMNDGNIALSGTRRVDTTSHIVVSKTSYLGIPYWTREYTGAYSYFSKECLTDKNDNIYIVGETDSNDCVFLIKINKSGTKLFQKTYSYSPDNTIETAIIYGESLIILPIYNSTLEKTTIVAVDFNGNVIFSKSFSFGRTYDLKQIDSDIIFLTASAAYKFAVNTGVTTECDFEGRAFDFYNDTIMLLTDKYNVSQVAPENDTLWSREIGYYWSYSSPDSPEEYHYQYVLGVDISTGDDCYFYSYHEDLVWWDYERATSIQRIDVSMLPFFLWNLPFFCPEKKPLFGWEIPYSIHGIERYDFFLDNALLCQMKTNSYLCGDELTDGLHEWYVVAYDSAGNSVDCIEKNSFIVDTEKPQIEVLSASDTFSVSKIELNSIITDVNGIRTAVLKYIKESEWDSLFMTAGQNNTYCATVTCSGEAVESIGYFIKAVDNAGNVSYSPQDSLLNPYFVIVRNPGEIEELPNLIYVPPVARENISVNAKGLETSVMKIYSVTGRLMKKLNPISEEGGIFFRIPVEDMNQGLYILKIEDQGISITRKISVIKEP